MNCRCGEPIEATRAAKGFRSCGPCAQKRHTPKDSRPPPEPPPVVAELPADWREWPIAQQVALIQQFGSVVFTW